MHGEDGCSVYHSKEVNLIIDFFLTGQATNLRPEAWAINIVVIVYYAARGAICHSSIMPTLKKLDSQTLFTIVKGMQQIDAYYDSGGIVINFITGH